MDFFLESRGWFGHTSVILCVHIDLAMDRSLVKDTLPNTFLIPWSSLS